jgi:hypothetical protein
MMKKLSLGLLAATFACNPTDTGNPVDEGNSGELEGGYCDATVVAIDTAFSEPVAALGFSPQALLDTISGSHVESLAWLDEGVRYFPESGAGELTLDIQAVGAPVVVDRQPRASTLEGGEIALIGSDCHDLLRVPVRVLISTAGGALDESVDTTLSASAADFASGSFELPLDALSGSFQAEVEPPNGFVFTKSPALLVTFGVSQYGVSGELGLLSEFESTDGGAIGQGGVGRIAQFPADNFCGLSSVSVGADQVVRGLSMASVLAQLNAESPLTLDGEQDALSVAFESSEERLCVDLSAPVTAGARMEFEAQATLLSTDAQVDGQFPVRISAEADASGAVGQVSVQAGASSDDRQVAADLAASFGIQEPLDFAGYDGGAVRFQMDLAGAEVSGFLRAYGLDVADCVTNPPAPDPDGMGSPGCRGTDRIELWGVVFED